MKFIYVFKAADKESLLKKGYTLLKESGKRPLWIFENNTGLRFQLDGVQHILSDTITF